MVILAGDIGGTKSNLGLFERSHSGDLRLLVNETYPTQEMPSPHEMIRGFLDGKAKVSGISASCLGIAGPVEDGECFSDWLPWKHIKDSEVEAGVGLASVSLINDMVANAWGVTTLNDGQLYTLQEGEPKRGRNRAVISAGTGLGESGLIYDDGHYHAVTCEGGHTDFAPRNEIELKLFNYLHEQHTPVTQESVICGRGLVNVYNFFRTLENPSNPQPLAKDGGLAGDIAAEAARDRNSAAAKAIDLFISAYGARAGNVCMQFMATGGIYLGGGIAPKNLDKLKEGIFLEAFLDKGKLFRTILKKVPVYVILEQKTALYGAAEYAAEHAK